MQRPAESRPIQSPAESRQPPAASPVIEVRGLEVSFPSPSERTGERVLKAADDVSFALRPGEVLGLVGESGCGKSVTALSLLGLVPPPGRITGGSAVFEGADLLALPESTLQGIRGARISMIFQEPMTALNPVFTIGEQVAEVLRAHRRMDRARAWRGAVEALARVGIADAATRARAYPHEISGGMRQRAMIAMALACGPDVLIADEPTTALDVIVQAQIVDLLLEVQSATGLAVLFISHDLGVISEVADRVMVMYAGRLVEEAPAEALFSGPLHPYTRGLIDTLPGGAPGDATRRRLPAIPGTVPDLRALPQGCRFAERCPLAEDACRAAEPPLQEGADGRRVACFMAGPSFKAEP
ncbi:MAG: ABC transporter ATP-binding protein [Rhodospirillales bacterium]|jgi:oligopeptide/dipeptide ABC transporter ATP-binding protein|nr:ABC transporter ATP-binding protein [Rhodospirillales bacterium]MDP6775095.1 ABC transporter ATP-binding protein [Rhodospirillales bacterium]